MNRVADYEIVGSIAGQDGEPMFTAVPPRRLGLSADRVMLKVVQIQLEPKQLHRAAEELRILAAVKSPFLVDLYDAGQDGDKLFYSMEHPSGGTLEAPSNPLGDEEKLAAVADAARGAHALHEAGVAHRNIRPSCILLYASGAKLADLGMAKHLDAGTSVSMLPDVSDIEFVDPAIMTGEIPSRASDVWSLGAALHWAMSGGQLLHPGRAGLDPFAAMRRVLTEPPLVSPDLAPAVGALVARALARDPAERPATAEALALEIDRLAGGK
ncbi:MAG TPA: protein kinase [Acidimicrobiales bacterium]|jgi:serine/threonine protein kinase|nr:protein kinase [Acidimicrobiales bacterium]